MTHAPGPDTQPITFCLVVDNFSVKYVGNEHTEHHAKTLEQLYTITTDWEGRLYCGLTLTWDYINHTVDMSMPGYVDRALTCFSHLAPTKPQHAPQAWTPPSYGTAVQLTDPEGTSPLLDAKGITRLQEVIGTLLYYARAIDSTMLVALGSLASTQTKGTEATA